MADADRTPGWWSPGRPATRVRSRPSSSGATRGSSSSPPPRAPRPGRALDRLYPALSLSDRAHRARPRAARGRRRGDRRLPARRRRRRWSPRCAAWGSPSSTSRPTSGSSTPRPTSSGTAPHGDPSLLESAVYGLTELDRERIAASPSWSPTPAAIRPPRCWRWRPWPSAAGRLGDRRREVRGLRRRPRRRRARLAGQPDRELDGRTRSTATATCPEIEQEMKRAHGRRGRRHVRAASAADRPGAAGELLRRPRRAGRGRGRALRRALRRRPVRRGDRPSRRGFATCARPTSAGSTRRRSARVARWSSPRSTTSGRAPRARRSRTST